MLLAECLMHQGNLEEALVFAKEGYDITQDIRYAYGHGWSQRCPGRINRKLGNFQSAVTYLQDSITTFEELGARFELTRTIEDLAYSTEFKENQ